MIYVPAATREAPVLHATSQIILCSAYLLDLILVRQLLPKYYNIICTLLKMTVIFTKYLKYILYILNIDIKHNISKYIDIIQLILQYIRINFIIRY